MFRIGFSISVSEPRPFQGSVRKGDDQTNHRLPGDRSRRGGDPQAPPSVVFDAAAVTAGFGITTDLNPSVLIKLEDSRIHVASDDADGFLGAILPAEGITATVDLEASWSHRDGLNIKGGAGLSTVLDLHQKAGPLRVDSLALALKGGPQGLTGTVGITGGASIGPVSASVADVGVEIALKFSRGNLGPVDLGARFKPPSGIGLSVDARGIVTPTVPRSSA